MNFDVCQNGKNGTNHKNTLKYNKYVFPENHPETSDYINKRGLTHTPLNCFSWLQNAVRLVSFFKVNGRTTQMSSLIDKIVSGVQILLMLLGERRYSAFEHMLNISCFSLYGLEYLLA